MARSLNKVCLTGLVHDVTNARTSQIEKYTQQYYGSKASAPFVGDHRIVDNRARTGLLMFGIPIIKRRSWIIPLTYTVVPIANIEVSSSSASPRCV